MGIGVQTSGAGFSSHSSRENFGKTVLVSSSSDLPSKAIFTKFLTMHNLAIYAELCMATGRGSSPAAPAILFLGKPPVSSPDRSLKQIETKLGHADQNFWFLAAYGRATQNRTKRLLAL